MIEERREGKTCKTVALAVEDSGGKWCRVAERERERERERQIIDVKDFLDLT